MNSEVIAVGKALFEEGRQIAIQLYTVQASAGFCQVIGNSALPGANFQQAIADGGIDRIDDALDHLLIMQKILAEAFARLMGFAVAESYR